MIFTQIATDIRRMSQNGPSDVPPSSSSSELPRLTNGRTKSQASTASSTRDSGISLSDHNRDEEMLDAVENS